MIHNMTFNSPLLSGFVQIRRALEQSAKSTQGSYSPYKLEPKHRQPQGREHTITIRSDNVQACPDRISAKG